MLCDHNRDGERVRDWLQGVVVQADHKMVAVQFVEDVYLTDGWMVPDRVLWCPARCRATSVRPPGGACAGHGGRRKAHERGRARPP